MNALTIARTGAVVLSRLAMAGSSGLAQGTLAWDKTFPRSAPVEPGGALYDASGHQLTFAVAAAVLGASALVAATGRREGP